MVVAVPWGSFREVGRLVGAAGDGLLVGLVVGFVALTAVAGPAAYLGLPWPIEVLLSGTLVASVALVGMGAGLIVRRTCRAIARRIAAASTARAHPRIARVVASPFRLVVALPTPVIGAFGLLLAMAVAGKDVGPLGLLTPGLLGPFVYVAGITGLLIRLTVALGRPAVGRRPGRLRRGLVGLGIVATLAWTIGAATLAFDAGTTAGLVGHDPAYDGLAVTPAGLSDPGSPGSFEVDQFSYGSGHDERRPAFGSAATVITPTVDASAVLPRLGAGADEIREWFWGFGPTALPLDGLVWMPRGDGPFPLVLVVHGNHAMGDFSEDGYGYLAEHLASRGFIAVSVDQDFLNGSWVGEWHGNEQLVRAWLLLLHLDQWRTLERDAVEPGLRQGRPRSDRPDRALTRR